MAEERLMAEASYGWSVLWLNGWSVLWLERLMAGASYGWSVLWLKRLMAEASYG